MTFYLLRLTALPGLFPTTGFQNITESRSTEDFPCLESTGYLTLRGYTAGSLAGIARVIFT
jgi:hypothetical protein